MPQHTVGHEHGNRYAARTRSGVAWRRATGGSSGGPSPKPRDAADLLAKIDALYQELTLQPLPAARKQVPAASPARFVPTGLAVIAILIVVLTAGEIWLYQDRKPAAYSPSPPALPAVADSQDAVPAGIPALASPPTPAAEPPPVFKNVHHARDVARRKAEQQRRVAELEAQRRAAAEEQARADRARQGEQVAAQQPQPHRPASPAELCAGNGNFLSRGFCEARACQQAEWANHPDCVRRREEQLKALGSSGGG